MRKVLSLLMFCCFIPSLVSARAQQTLGSLNGTVLDASGAAVPGSTVTVTDAAIGVTRATKSQGNGFFQIFNLPVGTYKVQATHDGFDTTEVSGIAVQEAQAKTVTLSLKVGQISTSVEVTANPLLNATDDTNGYTLDAEQIQLTPLATGSFTQLAVLSPGVSAELLSNLDSNSGLGNQPIWANGQRDTSNTFQVNGVDATNLFNGKTSSGSNSQRYAFNIGQTPSAGGAAGVGTSVYGSNGNSLPSPPPEFLQEIRVNTSMYDAQQGATSGAQIDANTNSGTNAFHGQMYGSFANNSLNASPFFFKQEALLSSQGVGAFPGFLANPSLHRWTAGATLGGPLMKNKLFFFVAYQHRYNSDQGTGISQMNVPIGLTDDRSAAGLNAAAVSYQGGGTFDGTIDPIAAAILNAKLPNGQYLIPSSQNSAPYQYGVPNVTLLGTSTLVADQATASVDYDVSKGDRLSVKYFYQTAPVSKPYGFSQTGGFPVTQNNGAQVFAIDNTVTLGSRVNWEQRLGFDRMGSYSYFTQTLAPDATLGASFGIDAGVPATQVQPGLLAGLFLGAFANDNVSSPSLTVGPASAFVNTGYYQNRINPSTNVIFSLGKHTLVAGGGYSYTQLNIENNRQGIPQIETTSFESFLQGEVHKSNVLESIDPVSGRNNANRYYRSNEIAGYAQDKWQALSNLSITAGVRYDYHGGLTEKYGNMFNFDPKLYDVTGTAMDGFTVTNSGFVVAGNNKYFPTSGTSNSTLTGRQWGISPRVGFAYSPKRFNNKVVINGGAGMYYDRGELFTYLSQPAGSGNGGPFGVTESAPLASYVTGNGRTLSQPLGTAFDTPAQGGSYIAPTSDPSTIKTALQNTLGSGPNQPNGLTGTLSPGFGPSCGAVDNQANYTDCLAFPALNFAAYDKNNVLPYTINFALNVQWQPANDLAITLGYSGNRGRHSVIPIPFNEPGIATPTNPIHGETSTYGFQVLNQNSITTDPYGYDNYNAIGSEPWDTPDGGNTDFRAPYVGYSPNAALFRTVGVSAYDALEVHVEKRLSHHFQAGVSYTWSHALDEQSDIGLFFTGNNPNRLRDSYASSDFDRTHTFSANFQVQLPNAAKEHSLLAYATNDWSMTGIGILQSGEPYSLYEFYGAVGSLNFGNYPTLMNPVLPIKNPKDAKTKALTGNSGAFRGSGADYLPAIDPSEIAINYVAPGTKGVPTAAMGNEGDPVDIYETDFAPDNQRNIFRQAMQKRLDISFRKGFHPTEKVSVLYEFNIFNVTNTTSLDVPQDQTQIRQNFACSNSALDPNNPDNQYENCALGYLQYGQIATADTADDQQTALTNLDQKPYHTGTGKSIAIPTTLPVGTQSCTQYGAVNANGCPNNGANFGSVTGTIGGNRAVTMGLHLVF